VPVAETAAKQRGIVTLYRWVRRSAGILILGLGIIALIWAAILYESSRSERVEMVQARRDAANLATAFREHVRRTAGAIDQLLITIAAEQTGDRLHLPKWLDDAPLLKGVALQVSLIGPDGLVRESNLGPTAIGVNVADRPHFLYHRDASAPQPYISVPVLGRVSKKWSIQFTRRIDAGDGRFGGVVVASIDPFYFTQFFNSVDLGADGVAVLAGLDGIVRARRSRGGATIGQDISDAPIFQLLSSADTGTYRARSMVDGVERVYGYTRVPDYPLVVGVGMAIGDVLAHVHAQQRSFVAAGIGLTCIIGMLTWFLAHETNRRRRQELTAQVELRTREQKRQLDVALDNMHHGLVMFDRENRVVVVNSRYIEMYRLPHDRVTPGCSARQLLEERIAAGTFAHDVEHYLDTLARDRVAGAERQMMTELPDGRTVSVTDRGLDDGGWISTHEDISERIAAEHQAKIAHDRMADAFEVIPEGLALFDQDDRYVAWNRRYAELYADSIADIRVGVRFDDVLRAGCAKGQYPDAVGREEEWIAERLAHHAQAKASHLQQLPGDRWLRIEERRTADGGSIGVRVDITELKRSEASFKLLFDANPLPMWVYDRESFRFLAVNGAAIGHYGYTREQFRAMTTLDIRPVEAREEFRTLAGTEAGTYEGGKTWRHLKADGTEIEVAIYARSLQYEGHEALLVAAIDITERKHAEDEVRRTREFLQSVIDNVPAVIAVKTVGDRRLVLVNRTVEKFLGLPREQIIGRTTRELFPPASAERIEKVDQAFLDSGKEMNASDYSLEGGHGQQRVMSAKRMLIRDAAGQPHYLLTVSEDITDRLAMERQLQQAQKMEAVGNLTGGIAHDFNNLLTVIIGMLDVLHEDVIGGEAADMLDAALQAAQRGADLTRQMLAFARRQPLQPKHVRVNDVIAGMARLLTRVLGENVAIETTIAEDIWPIFVDATQLETALINIAINARDAMPTGGILSICVRNEHVAASDSRAGAAAIPPGEYVTIAIADTGTGMAPEVQARIFEPFFTTKAPGKGTGLGLSMVYGFVKQSQGHIALQSTVGQGTTFTLFMPRSAEAAGVAVAPKSQAPRAQGEVILAVDDNRQVRMTVVLQLKALGYSVREAENAEAALAILRAGEHVDLLLTDVVMPGMSGKELATQAVRLCPELKVLFTSGFQGTSAQPEARLSADDQLLIKPYRKADLARALRDVLDRDRKAA